MALISCPECGREISDQAEACPSCGCPVPKKELAGVQKGDDLILSPQQDESTAGETSEQPKKKKKKGKLVAAVLAALLVVGGLAGFFIYQSAQKSNYKHIMLEAKAGMYVSAFIAEIQCDLTSQVWHDAIFEEENFETEDYVVPGDFNSSIMKLYASTGTITRVDSIKNTQDAIKKYISQLQNPPAEYRDMYDTLNDLYLVYQSAIELAIDPSGSLTQYNNNKNKYYGEFKSIYSKLDAMLPEPPPDPSSSSSGAASST